MKSALMFEEDSSKNKIDNEKGSYDNDYSEEGFDLDYDDDDYDENYDPDNDELDEYILEFHVHIKWPEYSDKDECKFDFCYPLTTILSDRHFKKPFFPYCKDYFKLLGFNRRSGTAVFSVNINGHMRRFKLSPNEDISFDFDYLSNKRRPKTHRFGSSTFKLIKVPTTTSTRKGRFIFNTLCKNLSTNEVLIDETKIIDNTIDKDDQVVMLGDGSAAMLFLASEKKKYNIIFFSGDFEDEEVEYYMPLHANKESVYRVAMSDGDNTDVKLIEIKVHYEE